MKKIILVLVLCLIISGCRVSELREVEFSKPLENYFITLFQSNKENCEMRIIDLDTGKVKHQALLGKKEYYWYGEVSIDSNGNNLLVAYDSESGVNHLWLVTDTKISKLGVLAGNFSNYILSDKHIWAIEHFDEHNSLNRWGLSDLSDPIQTVPLSGDIEDLVISDGVIWVASTDIDSHQTEVYSISTQGKVTLQANWDGLLHSRLFVQGDSTFVSLSPKDKKDSSNGTNSIWSISGETRKKLVDLDDVGFAMELYKNNLYVLCNINDTYLTEVNLEKGSVKHIGSLNTANAWGIKQLGERLLIFTGEAVVEFTQEGITAILIENKGSVNLMKIR